MAAIYGVVQGVGAKSGKTYSKEIYLNDTVGDLANFDVGQGAGSGSPVEGYFNEPVIVTDIALNNTSGLANIAKLQVIVNGVPTGDMIRAVIHDDGNAVRPSLRLKLLKGTRLQFIQLA